MGLLVGDWLLGLVDGCVACLFLFVSLFVVVLGCCYVGLWFSLLFCCFGLWFGLICGLVGCWCIGGVCLFV